MPKRARPESVPRHPMRLVTRRTGLTPARLRTALRSDRDGDDTIRLAAAFVRGRA